MSQQLHLAVSGYSDSDDAERADLGIALRSAIVAADVDVSHPHATAPEGAKGSNLEWAQLVVTLTAALPAVVGAIRSWLGRHAGASITLTIGGDSITISEPSDAERAELLEAWLGRHDRE